MNKCKLQQSVIELHKLNNQIRVELNHVRQTRQQQYPDRSPHTSKRVFRNKTTTTGLLTNNTSQHMPPKESSKKVYPKHAIANADFNKATERRHYDHKFADNVQLSVSARKKNSSYLKLKTQTDRNESKSPLKEKCNTSLFGIGINEKSVSKAGKRIIHNYHIYKEDFI